MAGNTPTQALLPTRALPPLPLIAILGLLINIVGCGTTQFESKNRHLLEALQTAVTSKNSEWLGEAARQIENRHAQQGLSKAEYKALKGIVVSAQAGDWKTAESRVFALSEGQKPTAADLARVKERRTAK